MKEKKVSVSQKLTMKDVEPSLMAILAEISNRISNSKIFS